MQKTFIYHITQMVVCFRKKSSVCGNTLEKSQIFFSIDDVDERFNYIRHPGKFNEVFENIEKFTKLEGNIEFAIFQTIGILNICNQKELTEYVKENIPMHIHIIIWCLNPAHVRKMLVLKKLKEK